MTDRKVTLSEVAKRAGVSLGAASKVLNGGTSKIGVGAEARKRILEAARQLDYHPNMAASILAGGSSKLIGVFIDSFANYRTLRLLQEIERISSELGYRIMTSFSHDNIANMKEDYLRLQRYGVTGFICCAHDYPEFREEVADLFAGTRNVVFMEKPSIPGMPYVATSRVKALTAMIADARRNGRRKIGLLHGCLAYETEHRLLTEFKTAMEGNSLEIDPKLIFEYPAQTDDPKIRVQAAMEKMILPFHPDFIFLDDAPHAVALRTQLFKAGLDITIHGGNGDPIFDDLDVNTFDPDYKTIAEELLEHLFHPENKVRQTVINTVYKPYTDR